MLMRIWTLHLDAVVIVGPSSKPANANPVSQILRYSKANDGFLPLSLLEELARDKGKFKSLKKMDIMYYGCNPLEKSAGKKISKVSSRHMVSL
jgi:hypothetical protein